MIGSDLSQRFLLMLPLPLLPPGEGCRLHGVVYCYLDAGLNPVGKKEALHCRLPPYVLPSPAYMLALGIDPSNSPNALTELEFYGRIKRIFDEKPCLVTYSFRYLEALNAIGLRTFRGQNIFAGLEHVIDVRHAIDACRIFGSTRLAEGDLAEHARLAGFDGPLDRYDHFSRLDALAFLLRRLKADDPRILNFCFTPLSEQKAQLDSICRKGGFYLRLKNGQPELLKCLDMNGYRLKALTAADYPHMLSFSILSHDFLCPCSVLTPARQEALHMDLQKFTADLDEIARNKGDLELEEGSYFDAFLEKLRGADLDFYREFENRDPRALNLAPLQISGAMRRRHFLFKADNLFPTLLDSEQEQYRSFCVKQVEGRIKHYVTQANTVSAGADEKNPREAEMLKRIANYPMTL